MPELYAVEVGLPNGDTYLADLIGLTFHYPAVDNKDIAQGIANLFNRRGYDVSGDIRTPIKSARVVRVRLEVIG